MTIPEMIVRLEKRVIALEKLAGIEPEKSTLVHPKALAQAEFKTEQAAVASGELKK